MSELRIMCRELYDDATNEWETYPVATIYLTGASSETVAEELCEVMRARWGDYYRTFFVEHQCKTS